jgi:hypothetical protein
VTQAGQQKLRGAVDEMIADLERDD